MKTTILGGILFLAPLAVLAIIVGKVFQMSLALVEPIDNFIPIESFVGVATVNILAIIFILVVCYIAGLLAKWAFLGNRLQRLDGLLMDLIPPYAVFKALLGSAGSTDEMGSMMRPVLARFDDYEQIAFEMERNETHSVLFLPGSPSAWSGTTVVADIDRIHYLEMSTHQSVKLLRTFGRGTLGARALVKQNRSDENARIENS